MLVSQTYTPLKKNVTLNAMTCVPADLSAESDYPIDEVVSPSTTNKDNETLLDIETDKDEVKIENVPPELSTSKFKRNKSGSVSNQDMLD